MSHTEPGIEQSNKNNLIQIVWSFLKHPITGIIITIIVSCIIFYLSRSEKEPLFSVSEPDLIAQIVEGEDNLKISWNDKEIKNVKSVKVALWNNGSSFIDKEDISKTNPIRIESSQNVVSGKIKYSKNGHIKYSNFGH